MNLSQYKQLMKLIESTKVTAGTLIMLRIKAKRAKEAMDEFSKVCREIDMDAAQKRAGG